MTTFYRVGLNCYKVSMLNITSKDEYPNYMVIVTLASHRPRPVELFRIEGSDSTIQETLDIYSSNGTIDDSVAEHIKRQFSDFIK